MASELVRFQSFKGEESPIAEFLHAFFTARGYSAQLDELEPGRFQSIATLNGSGGGQHLMLNGHLDINSLARGWQRDPWRTWVDQGRLFGHGVYNMKAGLATMIAAAEAIRQSGVNVAGDVILTCVAGHGQGGIGTHHLLGRGVRADAAVVLEPNGIENLMTVHAGIVHLAIHVYGRTAHISRKEEGINAVEKAARVIEALRGVRFTYTPRADLPDLPRMNIGSVIGGRGEDYVLVEAPYVPDICTLIVNVHFLPGQSIQTIVADITRAIDSARDQDPQLDYRIESPPPPFFKGGRRLVMPALDAPVDSAIVQSIVRQQHRVTGHRPSAIGAVLPWSYSSNDTGWLWSAGIPCLVYGPGGGSQASGSPEAHISIDEMVACARTLVLAILDFSGPVRRVQERSRR